MAIGISSENQKFLDTAVASGTYPTKDAAIDRAVSMLRERQQALDQARKQVVALPELPAILVREADGYVSVRGHRIGLHLILDRHFAGDSRPEIEDRFESLTAQELEEILDFVSRHEGPMREYLDQQDRIEQLMYEIGPHGPSMAELRARWVAKFGQPLELP
jgi:uncharacterized protein (DUF433 family)